MILVFFQQITMDYLVGNQLILMVIHDLSTIHSHVYVMYRIKFTFKDRQQSIRTILVWSQYIEDRYLPSSD